MNARRLMYKLQAALCARGRWVTIDQKQHRSERAGRMITRYIVREGREPVCETYRPVEVVQALAALLSGDDGGDAV